MERSVYAVSMMCQNPTYLFIGENYFIKILVYRKFGKNLFIYVIIGGCGTVYI